MLYSAFHFDYPYSTRNLFNIGDYIQSLAAIRFLPRVDFTIDRDSISSVKPDKINDCVKLIGNSWYVIRNNAHVIPDCIDFLPISVHINNPRDNILEVLKSWAKFGPIGCRDIQTKELIHSYGIDAYFSSCLTTTLTPEYVLANKGQPFIRKKVLLVDVIEESPKIRFWPPMKFFTSYKRSSEYNKCIEHLKKLVQYYDGEEIEKLTHMFPMNLKHSDRFEIAKNLLKKYATAKLVITSRIHCALPCLALGTPVVLMTKKYDELRYRGLYNYLNHIGLDENLNSSTDIEFEHGEVVNKDLHVMPASNLIARCKNFAES